MKAKTKEKIKLEEQKKKRKKIKKRVAQERSASIKQLHWENGRLYLDGEIVPHIEQVGTPTKAKKAKPQKVNRGW